MSIGSRIKSLRIKNNLTQKQLGELCGMADSAIRRYESDRGNPTDKTLRRIAEALNVSTAYLQGWDDAVSELEAVGMSIEDIATEMNIPVERIMEIINSEEPSSTEAAEKIIRVASLLTKEATRNTQKDKSPDMTGKTVTFQPITKTDNELLQLGGFDAFAEFYNLPEDAKQEALKDIKAFIEFTIAKHKKQRQSASKDQDKQN